MVYPRTQQKTIQDSVLVLVRISNLLVLRLAAIVNDIVKRKTKTGRYRTKMLPIKIHVSYLPLKLQSQFATTC